MKSKYLIIAILAIFTGSSYSQNVICGLNDTQISEETQYAMNMAKEWNFNRSARTSQNNEYSICKVAVDIDYFTYDEFKKDTTKIIFTVKQQLLEASKIFEKETNTKLVLTQVNIWKDPETDPYANTKDIFRLLSILAETWSKPSFEKYKSDVVMYLVTKPFEGAGGVAMSIGSKFNVSPLFNLSTIIHETGHNLGSPHTQNCSWPGGMLDYCYQSEGGCYTEALEKTIGTVMSYCSGRKITFHPLCQAIIENYSKKNFEAITKKPNPIVFPAEIQNTSNYYEVKNQTSSEKIIYQISSNQDFQNILYEDSTEIGLLYFRNLKNNSTYYLKAFSKNRFGDSNWSNVMKISNSSIYIDIPKILSPNSQNIKLDLNNKINLEFSQTEGATEYEIEITNYYNPLFRNISTVSIPTGSNSIEISLKDLKISIYDPLIWRVRALNNFQKSEWSNTGFIINKEPNFFVNFPFNDLNNAPSTFSFNFYQNLNYLNLKILVSEFSDFKNPILDKVYKHEEYEVEISFFLENLKPNTRYYYKIETLKSENSIWKEYPNLVIHEYENSFKTNNSNQNSNTVFFHKEHYKDMGFKIDHIITPYDKAIFVSDNKLQTINSENLELEVFDRKKTNGEIGVTYATSKIKSDADNNIAKIVILGKIEKYKGAFPEDLFALRIYDRKTLKQVSSTEFYISDSISYIQDFDPTNKLIFDGNKLCKIENKKLINILKFNNYTNIINSSPNVIWFKLYNNTNNQNELYRYTINNNLLEKVSLPPGNNYFNELKTDKSENIWINFANGDLGKFDGNNWAIFNYQNSPLGYYTNGFDIDNFGNLYVNSFDYYPYGNLLKFSDNKWTVLKDNLNFSSQLNVDSFGKLWMNTSKSALIRINPCPEIQAPSIESNFDELPTNEILKIKAKGCTNVVWNWKNKEESIIEKLIVGDNQLILSPSSNTTYFARCYIDGCSSIESSKSIYLTPKIFVNEILKNRLCENEIVKINLKIEGNFEPNNQFFAVFKNSDSQQKIELIKKENYWELKTGTKIPTGKFVVSIESTLPKIASKDSLDLEILSSPISKIEGPDKFCIGDTKLLVAKVESGNSPYKYFWKKDKTTIFDTNTGAFQLTEGGEYQLIVTDSKGCNSEPTLLKVLAYEYPTAELSKNQSEYIFLNKPDTLKVITQQNFLINWLKDGKIIEGATKNTLLVNEPGKFSVSVNNNGCIFYSQPISINLITGYNQEPISNNITIFPNPNNGIFTISAKFENGFTGNLFIYDENGRLLAVEKITDIFDYKKEANFSKIPSGPYYILFADNKLKMVSKFIKN
ncbi:hypothetical protein EGI22_22870 [Lacihabitans sp. LS3-19]|uniref:M12 family metallo-peptidase n=1 Tax=Lacihabitans sp. LS3-19 TaxID=2487335 RepID=UPI0020CD20B3|nr:M12 family metallo-peptidase [Lacihabitans sp. LS3-19]MCP9770757.1 hypothetical protein [Lacihabitans sp. LS3-19]